MELLLDSLMNLSAAFLLELGNTISSLFGGGTSSDAKENGTDAVQVRAETQTNEQLGLERLEVEAESGRTPSCLESEPQWSSSLTEGRLPCCRVIKFEPLPQGLFSLLHALPLFSCISGIPAAPGCPKLYAEQCSLSRGADMVKVKCGHGLS